MIWLAVFALIAAVFLVLCAALGRPRRGWEALGAALVLALAGYALQGQPQLPAAPHGPAVNQAVDGAFLVDERHRLGGDDTMGDPLLVLADGYVRHGDFRQGAEVLGAAIAQRPADGAAWLALGNALVGQAQGLLTPAAQYAYARAAAISPEAPGPSFFHGLALASSGRLSEARARWVAALAHAPAGAPWRDEFTARLARLDRLMAAQAQMGMPR